MRYQIPNPAAAQTMEWPQLVTMWRDPRMVAWFLIAFGLFFAVRLPFAPLGMVPYFVEFHPGFVLLPILGLCWGPAAAWAALAAGLAGDALLGYWESVSFFRAIGWMVAVLCTQRLYRPPPPTSKADPEGLSAILGFLVISIPACCAAAVWPALQAGSLRYYPFCYIVSLMFLNNLVFLILFGPGLYRLLVHHTEGDIPRWKQALDEKSTRPASLLSTSCIWVGSVGSLVSGLAMSGWAYGDWPWSLYLIGAATGAWVRIVVAFFLLVLLFGLFWPTLTGRVGPIRSRPSSASPQGRTFSSLYLPPGD